MIRQAFLDAHRQLIKFINGTFRTRAVAANHDGWKILWGRHILSLSLVIASGLIWKWVVMASAHFIVYEVVIEESVGTSQF